jgi:hypothetical protein
MLTAGVIAPLSLVRARGDKVMLWFGITRPSWAAVRFADTHLRWIDFPSIYANRAPAPNWGLPSGRDPVPAHRDCAVRLEAWPGAPGVPGDLRTVAATCRY